MNESEAADHVRNGIPWIGPIWAAMTNHVKDFVKQHTTDDALAAERNGDGALDLTVAGQHLVAKGIDAKTFLLALLIAAIAAEIAFLWYVDRVSQESYRNEFLSAHRVTQGKVDAALETEKQRADNDAAIVAVVKESTRLHTEEMADLICMLALHDLRITPQKMDIPRSLRKRISDRCE